MASTTSAVGTYALASKLAGVVNLAVVQPVALGWMPTILDARGRASGGTELGRLAGHYLVLSVAIALLVAASYGLAYDALGLSQAGIGLGLVALLCLGNAISGLTYPINVGPYIANRPTQQVGPYVMAALVGTALYVPLVPLFGVTGAAIGLAASYTILCVLLFRASQTSYQIWVPWKQALMTAGALIGTYIAAIEIGRAAPPRGQAVVTLMAFGVIAGGLLAVYAARTGLYEDIGALRRD
jgi:O-antigen/teichoic acid export membrane protein